jgi:hypothetical protein
VYQTSPCCTALLTERAWLLLLLQASEAAAQEAERKAAAFEGISIEVRSWALNVTAAAAGASAVAVDIGRVLRSRHAEQGPTALTVSSRTLAGRG